MVAPFIYGNLIIVGHAHAQYVKTSQSQPSVVLNEIVAVLYFPEV